MKKRYIAPDVISVTIKPEKGYLASSPAEELETQINLYLDEQSDQSMEKFDVKTGWGGLVQNDQSDNGYWVSGSNHFWD